MHWRLLFQALVRLDSRPGHPAQTVGGGRWGGAWGGGGGRWGGRERDRERERVAV